jgi:hypothetical protein
MLVWTPGAWGDWLGPDTIRDATPVRSGPVLAINQRGDALLAWEAHDGIRTASARRGGRFAEPELIPGTSYESVNPLKVALAGDGSAVVAWTHLTADQGEVMFAATRTPEGGFTPAQVVSATDEWFLPPMVAVRRGSATVAWEEGGALMATRAQVGEPFAAPETVVELGRPTEQFDRWPALRIDRRGREHYAFLREGVETVIRGRRGRVTSPRVLVGRPVRDFTAAWAGRVLGLLWNGPRGHVRGAAFGERGRIRARVLRNGGFGPSLAAAPDGRLVVAWRLEDFDDPGPVLSSARVPRRRFTRVREVRGAVAVSNVGAAVSRSGHSLLTWSTPERRTATAIARGDNRFVRGREFDGAGYGPVAGLDTRGHGYIAWTRGFEIRYARYRP